ncbi:MAG TPA: ABC transporter permease [Phenylobacterium sp.]|jgi:ABC-type Na+ efflux pump permease subunit|nr:ABC transporter permease [Phenylobacterium sp.]
MIGRIWLIAGREFRAYALTASFWVALAIGPLLMAAALLLTAQGPHPALRTASLTLAQEGAGGVTATFSPGFPLSAAGKAQLVRVLNQDGDLSGPVRLAAEHPKPKVDPDVLRRFALLVMLWMTLTGSLGMLLQAVVRERSNRALESLLAAAGPSDIVFGKLLGVGGVSLLVMGTWLGSSAALALIAPASGGVVASLLQGFARPAVLAQAVGVYVLAFAFYGLTTVAVGALARDNADAQNLARPMFAVLLVVFFTAMASALGAHGMGWLVYLPPFTPFILLMQPQPAGVVLTALALLAIAAATAAWLAAGVLRLSPAPSFPDLRPWLRAWGRARRRA